MFQYLGRRFLQVRFHPNLFLFLGEDFRIYCILVKRLVFFEGGVYWMRRFVNNFDNFIDPARDVFEFFYFLRETVF